MDLRDFGAASKALANVRSNGHCECPGCGECSPWGCKATSATALLQYDQVVADGESGLENLRVLCEICDPQHPRRSTAPRALPNRRVPGSSDGPPKRLSKNAN
jgi:hypothetical protein